jgi:phosphatidylserine/phosphatidylglycerophosphate/cardiolipin synthase-like enzyme
MKYAFLIVGLVSVFEFAKGLYGAIPEKPLTIDSVSIHYSPQENLETIDTDLISKANKTIDIAAYILTSEKVLKALTGAATRGVRVRIILDGNELPITKEAAQFHVLAHTLGVEIRVKDTQSYNLMHLKSYVIDSKFLRTGSANMTASGLKQQNNDVVVIESIEACKAFERVFAEIWAGES